MICPRCGEFTGDLCVAEEFARCACIDCHRCAPQGETG